MIHSPREHLGPGSAGGTVGSVHNEPKPNRGVLVIGSTDTAAVETAERVRKGELFLRTLFLIGGTALLVLVLVSQICLRQIQRAYPATGSFVSVSDLDLHYVRAGNGRPVVLLHGRDGALQEYTLSIFDELARMYDVTAFDRPGYGHSQWPEQDELSLDVQAGLLGEAIQEMGIENPLLVGHSYGGAVALRYALDYPENVQGAVLLAPAAFMEEPPDSGFFLLPRLPVLGPLLTQTLLLPLGSQLAPRIYEQAFHPAPAPPEYVETMSALYLRPANFTATAGELAVMQESLQKVSRRYGEIEIPVTVVFGTADGMLDLAQDGEQLTAALPNAQLVTVDGAGHKVHHTHPEIAIAAINGIMER